MPINDEQFERGEAVQHKGGAVYTYEGRLSKHQMWGLTPHGDDTYWHVINNPEGRLYLEPDDVFVSNYRAKGGWDAPKVGERWTRTFGGAGGVFTVLLVTDDWVMYSHADCMTELAYARRVDNFLYRYRKVSDGD